MSEIADVQNNLGQKSHDEVYEIRGNVRNLICTIKDASDFLNIEEKPDIDFSSESLGISKNPRVQVQEVHKYGESDQSFVAILKIYSGDNDIENIRFRIRSDSESIPLHIAGLVANDSSDVLVPIHAVDPFSIEVKMSSYQIVQ